MKRLAVIAALILAPSLAASDSWERFELWNACEPIEVLSNLVFGGCRSSGDPGWLIG